MLSPRHDCLTFSTDCALNPFVLSRKDFLGDCSWILKKMSSMQHLFYYLSIYLSYLPLYLSLGSLYSPKYTHSLPRSISRDFIKTCAILSWKCRRYQINCSALARRCDLFGSLPVHVSTNGEDYRRRNPFVGIISGTWSKRRNRANDDQATTFVLIHSWISATLLRLDTLNDRTITSSKWQVEFRKL